MQIRTIPKSFFNSTEIQGIGDAIVKVIELDYQLNQTIIQSLHNKLKEALNNLDQSRVNSKLNTQTNLLEEADLVRDYAFRAFWSMIEAGAMRQNDNYRTAALAILNHFKSFDRSLYTFGYDKQTTALKDFIATMEKKDAQQALSALQMQDWLTELKAAQEQFLKVYEHKISEETQKKVLLPTREAREQVFAYLTALIQTMNALVLGGDKSLEALNTRIDRIIEEFETKARSRKTRKQNEGNQVEDDPVEGEY